MFYEFRSWLLITACGYSILPTIRQCGYAIINPSVTLTMNNVGSTKLNIGRCAKHGIVLPNWIGIYLAYDKHGGIRLLCVLYTANVINENLSGRGPCFLFHYYFYFNM